MGTWCPLRECSAQSRAWQAYFLPHAGFHHGEVGVGGLAHLPSLLEALNFEGERDFLMDFPLQSINQPQRNTGEARSGFLAGPVITKAPGWLCVFCSRWRLGQNSGRPSAAFACPVCLLIREVREERKEEASQRSRETPWFWNLHWGPSPSFCCRVDGCLPISKLLVLGVSTGTDQTNLTGL